MTVAVDASASGEDDASVGRPNHFVRARRRRAPHWWSLTHLAVFSGCSPTTLRRAAKWGDFVETPAGEVLMREGHGDYWFFVLVAGSVVTKREGRHIATIGPGEHFGHVAVVGLRPQEHTVVTTERSILFVLGAQQFISLLHTAPTFQRRVFPDIGLKDFTAFSRRCHDAGRLEWRALSPPPDLRPRRSTPGDALGLGGVPRRPPGAAGVQAKGRPPGRTLSLSEAAARLAGTTMRAPARTVTAPSPVVVPRWVPAAAAVAVVAVVALLLVAYHPPRAVITAGRPIDVAADIHVTGAPVHPVHGHYLLLWVRSHRPDLAQYLGAIIGGERMVAVKSQTHEQAAEMQRFGRHEYLDSRTAAARAVITQLGLDPRRVSIEIKDRGFTGPSAGLVYALALTDILGGQDLARGRVVAATGALEPGGEVNSIGWVTIKSDEARRAHASLLLVPAGQQGLTGGRLPALGVTNLSQAVAALRRAR
ncbi:MAG: Lon-like protease [Actinomycetota bacterium]|nr:Lon-like protease [Actinomycetota bacterium]